MKTVILRLVVFGTLLLAIVGCSRNEIHQKEGERIVRDVLKLKGKIGRVPEENEVTASGINLGDWRYAKISESAFMLLKKIGPGKRAIRYRSDYPGDFGSGWSIVDEHLPPKWLP